MTYEDYLDLLDEEDTHDNAVNYLNMGGQDTDAGETVYVSDTVNDYMNYGN
jgi:hypothetical protein|tara:strand:+ start:258 stop:410 length:153 start_codon:yes stop_codon:yes gene_type:complete